MLLSFFPLAFVLVPVEEYVLAFAVTPTGCEFSTIYLCVRVQVNPDAFDAVVLPVAKVLFAIFEMYDPFALSPITVELAFVLTPIEQAFALDAGLIGTILIQDVPVKKVLHQALVRLPQVDHEVIVVCYRLLAFQQPHDGLVGRPSQILTLLH